MKDSPDTGILRQPQPSDKTLDFQTYRTLVEAARDRTQQRDGNEGEFGDAGTSPVLFCKIVARIRDTPPGAKPPATPVFLYSAVQVIWDSDGLVFVAKEGGFIWDGTAANSPYVRLIGNPGFGPNPYNYGPLLTDAVVPVFGITQNSFYTTTGQSSAGREYHVLEWHIIYNGEDPVVHPFKCTVSATDDNEIIVGATRGLAQDHLKDHITIHKGGTNVKVIARAAPEAIVIAATGWVYYDINNAIAAPTVVLKQTAVWPPVIAADHLIRPLAYIIKGATITSIGQLEFSDIVIGPDSKFSISPDDTTTGDHETKVKFPNNKGDVAPSPIQANKSLIVWTGDPAAAETRNIDVDYSELDAAGALSGSEIVQVKKGAAANAHKATTTQAIADLAAGISTFLGLSDTPADYTGDAKKILNVNDAEDAVEFDTLVSILTLLASFNTNKIQFIAHAILGDAQWTNGTDLAGNGVKFDETAAEFQFDPVTIDSYDVAKTGKQFVGHDGSLAGKFFDPIPGDDVYIEYSPPANEYQHILETTSITVWESVQFLQSLSDPGGTDTARIDAIYNALVAAKVGPVGHVYEIAGGTAPGNPGSAVGVRAYVKASSKYFDHGDVLDIGSNDYSLSFWFKTSNNAVNMVMSKISLDSGSPATTGYTNRVHVGKIIVNCVKEQALGTMVYEYETVDATWDDGTWHHAVVVWDRSLSSNACTIYVDGVSEALNAGSETGTLSTSVNSTSNFLTGAQLNPASGAITHFFDGDLGMTGLWIGTKLTSTEAALLYAGGCGLQLAGFPGALTQPTLYCNGNEQTAGDDLIDQKGGNDGTDVNTVGIATAPTC